ncbi:amino acid ABC transporter substrate-binding protein [Rhodoferax koreense]|uniref:Amino acid ABC transporter substrate-binding protein n=1 Tax=Rhodoferax koreensis TaxID=1842727 RepID=A0A1P8JVS7_9BURK|nr:amino acid ABC transporter substrate-binding protein [Rhodoferax koreense]
MDGSTLSPSKDPPVNISKRHFALCLASAALLAAGGAQAQSALDNVLKTKTIRIAIPTDYPPYGSVDKNMVPQGLDIDMAQLIGARLGVKVELLPVTSANRIPYLQTHKADLVISTLGKNAEREKVIDFTSAYAPFFQGVFGPKSMSIKSFADLAGKTVATTRGAMEDQELAKVAPASLEYRRFEDNSATIAAFVAGQTQTIAASGAVAAEMIAKNPQINAEFKLLLKDSPCFVGVSKGEDALKAKVNEIIAGAKKDGTLDAMSKKWLGKVAGDLPV